MILGGIAQGQEMIRKYSNLPTQFMLPGISRQGPELMAALQTHCEKLEVKAAAMIPRMELMA